MERLLSKRKLNGKPGQSKETNFTIITKFFWRVFKNNKVLFFNCSLLAFLTATINFTANSLLDKLTFSNIEDESVEIKRIPLPFDHLLKILGWKKRDSSLRTYVSFLIVYFVLFKATFSIVHWYITSYCCNKIEKDLKIELFEMLTNSEYGNSSEVSSKMLTQFSSDVDSIAYNIWTIPNRLIYVTVSIFFNVYFNFKNEREFGYHLFFIVCLLFSSLFTTIYFLLRKSTKLSVEAKRRYEEDNRFIFERVSNLEYIKSVSSEELEKNKLTDHLNSTFKKNQSSLLWNVLFRSVPDYLVLPNIPLLFAWIITLNYFKNQVFSVWIFYVYFRAVRRLNSEISKVFSSILSLEDLTSNLSVVAESVNFLAEDQNLASEESANFTMGDVTFDKVTFAYPSRAQNNVIEDFSFVFEKDKKYGIAGKNGIGKSTITRILLKLYKVSKGTVLVNQSDLSTINTMEFHHNVCRLNNRPSFFNMSIAENIFYPFMYNKDHDLDKLIYAAKKTRIFGFVNSLPTGFDTILREGGIDLSEGQKQQLEAMKIFIKEYKIYVFDEILSNVHPSTRKVILANIFANIEDRLVITIDHHYDIFVHMDYVYTFSSRKLTRVRHPEKLLANKSRKKRF